MKKIFFSYVIFLNGLLAFCQNPLLLKDVSPGNNSGTIANIVKTSNYTFFNENDGGATTDRSLYRTDGTPGGTIKLNFTYLPDPPPSANNYISTKAEKLTALGNKVIFAGDNAAYYGEIWSSDGTQAGTIAIERFQPTINNRVPVYELAEMNGFVYYGVTATNNKTQIRRTDGTPSGTSLVYEFSSYTTAPETGLFKVINGILYFNLYDRAGTGIDQLWRCDGTASGTYLLKDFGLDQFVASWYMPANSGLFYWMIVKPGTGNVLWKSDGTIAGTGSVKTIGTTGNNNYPQFAATIGDNIAFAGLDGNGRELWTTDGTAAGTNMVADINPGAANSNPSGLIFWNGLLYFSATKADSGTELWKSDGSSSGTILVKDINPGTANSSPSSLVLSNNTILFRANTATTGTELWLTDGTAANTVIVADMNPGASGAFPNLLTPGNPVFFAANNGTSGFEVFKYDNSEGVLGAKKVWLTGTAFGNWIEAGVIKLTNNGGGIYTATNIQIVGDGRFKFTEGTWASAAGYSALPGFPTGVSAVPGTDITGTLGFWNVKYNYITKAYSFTPTPLDNWGVVGTATPNGWNGPYMPLTYDAISNKWSAVVSLSDGEIKFRNNNDWTVNYGDNGADGSLDTNGNNIAIAGGSYLITLDFNTLNYSIKSAVIIPDPNFEQALIDLGIDKDGVINASISRSDAEAVTELNVFGKNIKSLEGIQGFTNLSKLYCQNNQIQVLNISNNKALTVLECGGNQLNQLNVSQNPLLKVLGFGINNISQIDVSQNLNLETFWCNNNNITSQNLDLNSKLTVIGLSDNPLAFVSLKNGNNVNVVYFIASNTPNLACINSDAIVSVSMSNSGKTFSENCSTTSLAGSWIIAPETRALKVGPSPGSDLWWYLNQNDIAARACYMDDKYVFNETGSFNNVLGSETYLETWQGVASERCGAPVAPHNGPNATYIYNQNAGTITLNGPGAYLGLPKAVNGYILPSIPVPNSITYDVSFLENGNVMLLGINSGGAFWTYKLIKEPALKTYYVNDNSKTGDIFTSAIGNNNNIGTKAAPFATLPYAISKAQNGETIYVDAGTYTAAGTVNKSLTIRGANYLISPNDLSDSLLANGSRNAETIISNTSFDIGANNINIEGMTFDPLTNIAIKQTNNSLDFDNVKIANNIFRIKSDNRAIQIYGKFQMPLVTFDCFITGNRFIKEVSNGNTAIIVAGINNVQVLNNTFTVSSDIANRTQTDMNFGDYRIDNLHVSNNTAYRQNFFLNSVRSKMTTIDFNKVIECTRFAVTSNNLEDPCEINITDNAITDSKTTGGPVISYVRNNGVDGSSPNIARIERNIINQNVTGYNFAPQALIAPTLDNLTQNSQVFIRYNKLTYTGDFSSLSSTNASVSGIRFLNNSKQAVVERNEIEFNVTNYNPNNKIGIWILHTGLQPGTNFNIINNKVSGFTNSVAIQNTNGNFGELPDGVAVNVNNNSFTGDILSINNGTQSQSVNASCNWYGSAAAQDFINKLTLPTVDIVPWLTNGTDNDAAIGFQPVPNSCDGNPTLITLDNYTDVTCNGSANGSINITTTYGKVPFNYTWTKEGDINFVSHNEDPTDLAPGIYHLALVDGNGSTLYITDPQADGPGTIDVTITEPSILTATADGINNLCFGESTGTAFVVADGGTGSYTYLWNNGATTDVISDLSAGTYSVTVTDANGCTANASYEVTQPTLLTATINNNSTACSNNATVAATNGTPGYTYLWSNGATSTFINNVPVGTYTVTVTDNNGCSTTASITLTVGEAFNPAASVTDVSCFGGSNGTITVTNANGTAPFTFSKDGITFIPGTLPFSFNNLTAGTYNIAVKDSNGCTGFVSKTIAQPALLTATIITVQSTCSGQSTGAISVATAGGSGALKYSWTGIGNYTSTQKNISGLAAGSYTLTITDNNGCTTILNASVPTYNAIVVSDVVTNVLCRGSLTGAINLTVSGGSGSGFAYSWTGSTTSTSEDISNLGAGTNYNVTITDIGSGCIATKSYVITQPASNLSLTTVKTNATGCGGSLGTITATASGGTSPHEYKLDNGTYQLSGNFTLLSSGSYTVWVKDANGCTSSKVVAITDNGSDQYESNNSKSQAKLISINTTINARIALATDTADWFKFTSTGTGNYTLSLSHLTVNYTFNMYAAGNNTPALIPTGSTPTSKQYALTIGTTYYVQITGGLSFNCYDLSISSVSSAKYASTNAKVIAVDKLSVKAYPNPHQGLFNLSIISHEDGNAQIELFTILGQLLAKREVSIDKGQNTIVEFNDVGRGIILYHLTIGNQEANGKVYGKD